MTLNSNLLKATHYILLKIRSLWRSENRKAQLATLCGADENVGKKVEGSRKNTYLCHFGFEMKVREKGLVCLLNDKGENRRKYI